MAGFGQDPIPGMPGDTPIAAAPTPLKRDWAMKIVNGPRAGNTIALPAGAYTLGRNDPPKVVVDIDLTDAEIGETPMLSRRHARFTVTDRSVLVTDLNSTNGISQDGKRLDPGASVTVSAPGTVLRLANLNVEFIRDGA